MATNKSAPQLKQFAGFWTLTGQPLGGTEWSLDEKIRRAKAAGFQAMGGGADANTAAAVRAAGLDYICYIDANEKTYEDRLKAAASTGCARVNVQLWDHDTLPKVAAKTWVKMQPVAKKLKLEIDLEVHRDTCTAGADGTAVVRLARLTWGEPSWVNGSHPSGYCTAYLFSGSRYSRMRDV